MEQDTPTQTAMTDPWKAVGKSKIPAVYKVLFAISAISLGIIVYASYSVL